jgi:hypothetical protein
MYRETKIHVARKAEPMKRCLLLMAMMVSLTALGPPWESDVAQHARAVAMNKCSPDILEDEKFAAKMFDHEEWALSRDAYERAATEAGTCAASVSEAQRQYLTFLKIVYLDEVVHLFDSSQDQPFVANDRRRALDTIQRLMHRPRLNASIRNALSELGNDLD